MPSIKQLTHSDEMLKMSNDGKMPERSTPEPGQSEIYPLPSTKMGIRFAPFGDRVEATARSLEQVNYPDEVFKTAEGEWTAERATLHDELLARVFSEDVVTATRVAEDEAPQCIAIGGRAAAGKSWFEGNAFDKDKYLVLDANRFKEMLPEYRGWNAAQVHAESNHLVDRAIERAIELRLNVANEMSMATMENPEKRIGLFEEAGYDIHGLFMALPAHEAAMRAVERGLGRWGRYVPYEVVMAMDDNQFVFELQMYRFKTWKAYDNDVPLGTAPRLLGGGEAKLLNGKIATKRWPRSTDIIMSDGSVMPAELHINDLTEDDINGVGAAQRHRANMELALKKEWITQEKFDKEFPPEDQ